jgi:iron-sulfur cluster insertion protein
MNLDQSAVAKLQEILAEEQNTKSRLRVFVQGGGCSGMQYGFTLDEDSNEDDFEFNFSGVPVLVDSMSMQYLSGSTIKYEESAMGASFMIDNPNAETTCGCGSSFSPS